MKKIDLSKIKIVVVSKVLIEISSFLSMLSWKCIRLVDQEQSGQGQPIWATPLPSKWVFYSIKQGYRSDFCPPLYIPFLHESSVKKVNATTPLKLFVSVGDLEMVKVFIDHCEIVDYLGKRIIPRKQHTGKSGKTGKM